MAKKTSRVKRAAYPAARDRDDANGFIERIGRAQRERERIEAAMNDKLAKVKAGFEAQAAAPKALIEDLTRGLQAWCEANRDELTKGDKVKTHGFAAGEVSWRLRPPKVTLRKIEDVIAAIKARRLKRFLRTKEEVDKEAMLKEPERAGEIPGVTIGSAGEDFVVKPFETELEEVA